MIFAELEYPEHYLDIHDVLVEYLQANFENVQHGHQGDSWIWITEGNQKVEVDTFSSMKHQIKSARDGNLVQLVMAKLSGKYKLKVYETPELEGHEDQ